MAGLFDSYKGTIDLSNRKVLNNADGTISTEQSFGFSPTGETEILIPQLVDGKLVSKDEAKAHFRKTGEHLGTFDTKDPRFNYKDYDKYAVGIHEQQGKNYRGADMGIIETSKANSVNAAKAAELDKMYAQRAESEKINLVGQQAYDKGTSDGERSLAEMLYKSQMMQQPEPELGFNVNPMQSDAPQGVENMSEGLARQLGYL